MLHIFQTVNTVRYVKNVQEKPYDNVP